MTKIDIISGFLGAGKTTLIQKLLREALSNQKIVLIENEFGEIGIDGGFLQDAGIEIKEMNSGCICCSLVGDFAASLKEVLKTYEPERILIEPSGVGKLSDVRKAVEGIAADTDIVINSAVTVVDAAKCKMYSKNFGEFFTDQIANAGTVILSRTGGMSEEKIKACVAIIREQNQKAAIVTTPWEQLDGQTILDTMQGAGNPEGELLEEVLAAHGKECTCGCHADHDHTDHDHHHADEIFTSWGAETPACYNPVEVSGLLEQLEDERRYGLVLRAKGMLPSENGKWIFFDYVPGECQIREGGAGVIGKICVIGSKLSEVNLEELFRK